MRKRYVLESATKSFLEEYWFPAFNFFKEILPPHTPCQYQYEMNLKSVVVSLPVLLKDEKIYADLVEVLDQLEAWVRKIYSKAGLCSFWRRSCSTWSTNCCTLKTRSAQVTRATSNSSRSIVKGSNTLFWWPAHQSEIGWCKRFKSWKPHSTGQAWSPVPIQDCGLAY